MSIPRKLTRSILYPSNTRFPVQADDTSSSVKELTVSRLESTARGYSTGTAPRSGGSISLPKYHTDGTIRHELTYVHLFNSAEDFSTANLITLMPDLPRHPSEKGVDRRVTERMNGGVYGWFYGGWSAKANWDSSAFDRALNHTFDRTIKDKVNDNTATPEETLSKTKNDIENQRGNEKIIIMIPDSKEPRSLPAGLTADTLKGIKKDDPRITQIGKAESRLTAWGRDELPMNDPQWHSSIHINKEPIIDASGSISSKEYFFAAVITHETMYPSRHAGDTYWRIPNYHPDGDIGGVARSSSSLNIGNIAEASGTGWDYAMGVLGVSRGTNNSSSKQTRVLMDINGDRYLDILDFADGDIGGVARSSSSLNIGNIAEASGTGWDYAMGVLGVSRGTNNSSSKQTRVLMDINGDRYLDILDFAGGNFHYYRGIKGGFAERVGTQARIEGLNSSHNTGITKGVGLDESSWTYGSEGRPEGFSINSPSAALNYSSGFSESAAGLYDINGDGLPDQVSGKTGASVYWNTGGNFSGTPVSLAALASSPLRASTTGSFGGAIPIKFGFPNVGGGVTLAISANASRTSSSLMDINGDGLPDYVTKDNLNDYFTVYVNTGIRFAPAPLKIYRPDWNLGDLANSLDSALNSVSNALDAVPVPLKAVLGNPSLDLTGGENPLAGEPERFRLDFLNMQDALEYNMGLTLNLGGGVSWFIPIILPIFVLDMGLGANAAYAHNNGAVLFRDVNGDGMPDHILKGLFDNTIKIKDNLAGKVGLLNTITLPQGGTVKLGYSASEHTTANPNHRWLFTSLERFDGIADAEDPDTRNIHTYTTTFEYSSGVYDREDRVFLGYGQVVSIQGDGSRIVTDYYNSAGRPESRSEFNGLMIRRETFDNTGVRLRSHSITYLPLWLIGSASNLRASVFPRMAGERREQWEAGTPVNSPMSLESTYSYDRVGNITRLIETDGSGRTLRLDITYAHDESDGAALRNAHITALPSSSRAY